MEFDLNKFNSSSFSPREEAVPVPDLAAFFTGEPEQDENGKPKPPVWKVRGLTGEELARVNEAKERNRNRLAVAEGLAGSDDEVAKAIQELIGHNDKVPDDLAKRLEMLVLGSVEPQCSQQLAVKLSQAFPVEFYLLTGRITQLTGQGSVVGKPKRSSGKVKSKSP